MAQINSLRPITYRLNTTPVEDLPRYAGYLATSILNQKRLIRASDGQKDDASIQINKLTTRVTSLLQDKTFEGRYTGIVLVKAMVEAVDLTTFTSSGAVWVRGLLSCLSKKDPSQIKQLAVITISRIFLLTAGNQTMVREITTPALPAFVTSCLNVIKPTIVSKNGNMLQIPSTLLQPVLQCWVQLIKVFPSTFRPFVPSIRAISLSLMSQTTIDQEVKVIAAQIFSLLHFCAPKDNPAKEWSQTVQLIIESTHQAADVVLRSVIEEWSPITQKSSDRPKARKVGSEAQSIDADAVGMDAWIGLQSGCSRIVQLVYLLGDLLTSVHACAVTLPIAEVLDLAARFAAVLPPTKDFSLRENKQIGREERDELFLSLPHIHSSIIRLIRRLALVFGRALIPLSQSLLSIVWDIFELQSSNTELRAVVYEAFGELLQKDCITLQPSDGEHISGLTHKCCEDIKRADTSSDVSAPGSNDAKSVSLSMSLHQIPKQQQTAHVFKFGIPRAAWDLLPKLLNNIPASFLTSNIRTELDRTAILSAHEEALLASVMNPPLPRRGGQRGPSTLPFLVNANGNRLALEALLRPRMPVVNDIKTTNTDDETSTIDEDAVSERQTGPEPVLGHDMQESQESSQAHTDPPAQAARKREHSSTDDVADIPSAEFSKRIRTEMETVGIWNDVNVPATSQNVDLLDVAEYAAPTDSNHVAEGAVSTTVPVSPQVVPKEGVSAQVTNELHHPAHNTDDDSDDLEIPPIDTALSSDEDDSGDEDIDS